MKKILFTLAILPFLMVSKVSHAVDFTVGVTTGAFVGYAHGRETTDGGDINTEGAFLVENSSQAFAEIDMGRVSVGVEYMFTGIETPENKSEKDLNTQKVELENLVIGYVALDVAGGFYVKAGLASGDLATLETMGSSSQSGSNVEDQSLDGVSGAIGYISEFDNGVQLRGEWIYTEYDNLQHTDSTGDAYAVNDLTSSRVRIGIAKKF